MGAIFDYVTGQRRPEQEAMLASYDALSVRARNALRTDRDVAYGPHPRQVFDYFHADGPRRGAMAYFHAGYWQSRDKAQFSFLAAPFVAAGYDVALVNYPLCPDVTLFELTDSVRASIPAILRHGGAGRIIVAGHSAGGHLAVELAMTDWSGLGLARDPVAAIIAISGVYDLEPLIETPLNDKLKLDSASAAAGSPRPRARAGLPPALFIVGALETEAFQAQTQRMHAAWLAAGNRSEAMVVDDACHFSILQMFANADMLARPIFRRRLNDGSISGLEDDFAADSLPPVELWPEMIFEREEFLYPQRLNCAHVFLDRWVEEGHGDRLCIVGVNESLTYREFQARVNRIANALRNKLGVVSGHRVLLRSANSITMAAVYFAVLKAGGIVVATMPLLRAREIAYPIEKARIALALCDHMIADEMERTKALAPALKRVVYWGDGGADSLESLIADESPAFDAVDTSATDVCLIAFTSGTTGEPKGTMHFHRDMLIICDGFARQIVRATPDDRFIGSAPFAFTFGLAILLFPMRIGGVSIVLERAGPDDLARAVSRFGATIMFTAPTSYRAMLGRLGEYDLSSLRRCISAGEALPKPTFDQWLAATGIRLIDGIGGTEMLHIYLSATEDDLRPGATGKPLLGYRAKVVDDEGRDLPAGQVGRLAVRGPIGCRYLADARQTKYVENGWNMPGDSYLVDDDGYFWHQARSDDMIVSAGYNIAGPEVEVALLTHPAIAECGVVGAPDEARGLIVKAYVVLRPGFEASPALAKELQDHAKAEIAPYKYPRAIEFVDALPKTSSGKLQRFALRQMAAGRE
jgi:2-aminobenzoate-CoA ligase